MARAAVLRKHPSMNGRISISLSYEGDALSFHREESEPLSVTLRCVKLSCEEKQASRRKDNVPAGAQDTNAPLIVQLQGSDGIISGDELLGDAINIATSLHVGETVYALDHHSMGTPTLHAVQLPQAVIATCPVAAAVQSENIVGECLYEWRVSGEDGVVGRHPIFVPSMEMGGKELEVHVSHSECTGTVSARANITKWNKEDVFVANRVKNFAKQGDTMRVMSFNLLAPMYVQNREYTDQVYPYCAPMDLSWDYRFALIAKEICTINPDIACLQEVQASSHADLYTVFPENEFLHVFWPKQCGNAPDLTEGCALALRKERFELLDNKNVLLRRELLADSLMGQEWTHKSWAPTVKTVIENLGTVAQICTVKEKRSSKVLVICNTHLFYHPDACHIRMLQVAKLIEILAAVVTETGATPIFVGDLNALPGSACMRFLLDREICADDASWGLCTKYVWKDADPSHVEVYGNYTAEDMQERGG